MSGKFTRSKAINRKKFAQEVIANDMDTTKAMAVCNPHLSKEAVSVKACRWLQTKEVYDAVIKELEALNLTKDKIAIILRARLMGIISDSGEKTADVVTAIDKMAKFEGIYNDGQITNNIILSDLSERLKTIKKPVTEPTIGNNTDSLNTITDTTGAVIDVTTSKNNNLQQ